MDARLGVFLFLLVTVLQTVVESGYIGCYQDDSTRILHNEVLKDKGMTVQKCKQFCGKKGFKFAGVEYGYECFCGNDLRKDRKRKESDCKTPCSGNKRQTCGGPWRISIYTAPKDVDESGYIGCYQDDSTRILHNEVLKDKGMTVQKCKQFCGKKGYKFAGVEYGYECFCGNDLRKDRKRKESDCKTPCSGNKRQTCGGPWRISIYTAPEDVDESGYIGCYQDDSTRILHNEVLKDKGMTVQKCKQFCGKKGYKFAGVEYGYECFCGNDLRKDRKRKESDCKTPCSGNKRQTCGGPWRISIYTAPEDVDESGYIGCYQDDSTRILHNEVLKDKGMTVQKCKQFCGKKGYKFAGVEYGYECFCGNDLRKDRKRKESDCKTPCSGNKRQTCGGPWRISIYTAPEDVDESGYIGCYQDDSTRILHNEVLKDKGMTVQKCKQFCGKKGYKFAGVEYGYECFCGNDLRKDRKRKESDCKTPCSGNKRQTCGGPWRISIYTAPEDVAESGYIGCYQDDSTRILHNEVLKDKGMTVQKCRQFCGKKGFKFAGVEYGYECFCGNDLRKDRKRKESDCKTPCSGNKRQTCGGPWRISIYTALEDVDESGYIGCYQDDSTRILHNEVLKDKGMTVQKCKRFCGKKGFKFAGVEYGYECFCGNDLRKDRKRKESDCKTPCSGNKRQTCGGPWRISIYTAPEDVDECRKSTKGTEYKGLISLTQTGRSCQYWERQYPHKHVFSNLKTEHNYCRNPDNSGQPWCYTNDPTTRWEYCKIPMCDSISS
ncbi:uncharacterized protein [Mytilus edulis]|uniref:uncharacterized protein isoform X2 n=1 Tax=Mytilus edulis TaxID=6550 RepID=UPI0039EF1D40